MNPGPRSCQRARTGQRLPGDRRSAIHARQDSWRASTPLQLASTLSMQAWRNLFTLFILILVLDKATIYGDLVRMTYKINILSKAQRYFDTLDERTILNIWSSIAELKKNPYRRRPLVDIIKLRGFKSPPMYRLRVGRHRLEYFIDENENAITVTNAFLRSGDSDYCVVLNVWTLYTSDEFLYSLLII